MAHPPQLFLIKLWEKTMRKYLIIAAALLAAAPAAALAATEHFHAVLLGASETPPTGVAGAGALDATLDTTTRTLTYTLTWSGLTGAATMAHFHGPAAPGVAAGVQVSIRDKASPGEAAALTSPVNAQAILTVDQVAQLEQGLWYVNVHSAQFPKGELRGQVTKQ
jgi:hypothetical protein